MSLKGKSMITKNGATEEELQEQSMQLTDITLDLNKFTKATIKDYNDLNTFMQNLCGSTHYDFQVH